MAYDLLIKNGTVIDGTGAPRRQADVAVKNGKIAEIGRIGDGAAKVIDAAGCVVAPGFIDPHTHYDAQICWDPAISPSSWHGVTSVVMGNCGVGIAPCKPEAREIAMRDLVNVEGIPFEVLDRGITWDWRTFPEFLDAAEKRGSALNLAFLAPLTPFRHWVMGEASMERGASPEETAEIAGAGARGGRSRRVRLLDHRVEPAHGLSGAPAGLPQRQPRRAESLCECPEGRRQGHDRDRADAEDFRPQRRGGRPARLSVARERPSGDVPRAVSARRHPRGLPRDAPPRRRLSGCDAADLAARADPRDQHAQPVLVRRLQELGPGVRGQVRERRSARSTPTRRSATRSARR